jgi:hypothetical protein
MQAESTTALPISTSRPQLRLLPLGDVAAARFQGRRALRIQLHELRPRRRHTGIVKDRLDGAFRHARFAIDALSRIDSLATTPGARAEQLTATNR